MRAAILIRRVLYRARQFFRALLASLIPLSVAERTEVRARLPQDAWPLFEAMPRSDQRHSLNVLRAVLAIEPGNPALVQAALLHDCAKSEGGVRLWHRVAVVLMKALWPGALRRWNEARLEVPPPGWRYLLWVHARHPQRGAALANAAGCVPLAVTLIRCHQDGVPSRDSNLEADRLLAVLQAADDDN